MLERNEKGFTLIEIIVSTAIGVVVLGLVLSIILTSFDTFGTFSTKKLKKEALDSIIDYVRDEVQNSTDVVISKTPPKLSTSNSGNWKWLAVANGRLYYGSYTYDQEKSKGTGTGRMYTNDSYYNTKDSYDRDASNTTLTMSYAKKTSDSTSESKTSTDKVRIVTFYYMLSNNSEQYKKNDAIEFSNVHEVDGSSSLNSGDIRTLPDVEKKDAVSLANNYSNEVTSFTNSNSSIMRVYYQKDTGNTSSSGDNNKPSENVNLTHTIADKINEINANNNRGYYVGRADNFQDSNNENFYDNPESKNSYNIPLANTYRPGDFVYYKGNWWLLMSSEGNGENKDPLNGANMWQCLDGQYHNGNYYNYGDIVKAGNVYYKFIAKNEHSWNAPSGNYTDDESNANGKQWLYLGTDKPTTDGYDKTFSNLADGKGANAITQGTPASSPALDASRASIPNVTASTTKYDTSTVPIYNPNNFKTSDYAVGSLIQVEVKNSGDNNGNNPYYRLYKKIFEPADYINKKDKVPGNSFQSGWKLLENEYMPSSSYTSGDTLRLGTSNLDNLDTTKDYIRVKTPKNASITFNYTDSQTNEEKRATITLSPMDICCSESEVYFGLEYGYINEYTSRYTPNIKGYITTYTRDNEQYKQFVLSDVDFNHSDITSWNTSDWALTKAMIYLPKETTQTEVPNAQYNGTVRNQIWERISYNDTK